MRDSKNSRFFKEQAASTILSDLGIKIPILTKIPIAGDILFKRYKMNEITNNLLLAGDRLTPQMHLRQPGFT